MWYLQNYEPIQDAEVLSKGDIILGDSNSNDAPVNAKEPPVGHQCMDRYYNTNLLLRHFAFTMNYMTSTDTIILPVSESEGELTAAGKKIAALFEKYN